MKRLRQATTGNTLDGQPDLVMTKADTGTLGKAVDVLEIVANADSPLRFTDILAINGQPRGTLHRQITNLVEEGLLSVNANHTFEIGYRLLQFASKAWSRNDFRRIAEPHIRELQANTGETVHLGIIKGSQVIYLDKVEGQQSVRMHSQIGNASPVYCTGVGKAALSTFEDSEIRNIMSTVEFVRHTPTTLKDMDALFKDIRSIRSTGLSWDREEHESGIHCVAAPVRSRNGTIAAGISATAPVFRVSAEQLQKWAPLVRETAQAISRDMAALSPRT